MMAAADGETKKPRKPTVKKTGRPLEYREDMPERAHALIAEFGMTDKQLGAALGVTEHCITLWKQRYPEFSQAVKAAKDSYDSGRVEKSLLRRAVGYRYKETVREPVIDPDTAERTMETIREVIREQPPDPVAMIFWLKNRQPQRWRDTKNIDHSGGVNILHVSNVDEAIRDEDDG